MRWPRWVCGLSALVFTLVAAYCYYSLFTPLSLKGKVWVEIKAGTSFHEVAEELSQKGLLRDTFLPSVYAKLTGQDREIKKGTYLFQGRPTAFHVLRTLFEGKVYLREVTVPEGYNIWQIARLLEDKGIVNYRDFLSRATDKALLEDLGIEGPSVEGYLFPDTYRFALNTPAEMVIRKMVDNLWAHLSDSLRQRASEMGLSIHQVLTLASLIEKEAKVPEERPLISAVFHNRLKARMPLASDPTAVYGIKPLSEGVTRADLRRRHPYNTYLRLGLPPGPICSPGLGSITAALYPADVKYLYFVSKGDGTHYFSTTLRQHLRAIDRYRRR